VTPLSKFCTNRRWWLWLGAVTMTTTTCLPTAALAAPIFNQATYTYTMPGFADAIAGATNQLSYEQLVDPRGQITGCAGEILSDYTGFTVGLYQTAGNDPTGTNLGGLAPLTPTEVPDLPNNGVPGGISPNTQNSNPFALTTGDQGYYSFLLDVSRGQLNFGASYLLVVSPPRNSIYSQRRIRIVIGARNGDSVQYTATALDGKPISVQGGQPSVTGTISVTDANRTTLSLSVLSLNTSVCQAQDIQIVKTGDRAAAVPGDTVIYRLSVKSLSSAPISNLVLTDVLPVGFRFIPQSVRAEIGGQAVAIAASNEGRTITFRANNINLGSKGTQTSVLNLVYGAMLTPDAIRGSGENTASVAGQRTDNRYPVKDGPSVHKLRIRAGIMSDCGTIIGRVFHDKNFDGEQQSGEPGIPNAALFLDDGTRITTDSDGKFSIANVLNGPRTGVLDLTSIPGWTFAPNQKFLERNSQSRLVNLEPGGLVRMNFAVTPAAKEVGQ
jgi:uncharacterized repeat protein (TIGR01451 family)